MDDLNLTAEELRDFRRVLGWSQQKLADELDVARNTVVRMENGQMAIERRTALAVRYLAWHHSMIERIPTKPEDVEATVPAVPEQGDQHCQIELSLPGKVDSKTQLPAADRAWVVFKDALSDRQGQHLIEESYFKLVKTSKVEYSYLFLLQLLERLISLPNTGLACCPEEWFEMGALRRFANKLYKANPQWH